jgi:Nitrate and nitrite sensing
VRSRLLLLITIPTLTAVVLGGTRIVSSVQSALTFQRIEQLAKLSSGVTTLAARLEDERDQTVLYLAQIQAGNKSAAAQLNQVKQQYALAKPWVAQVRSGVSSIGSTFPAQVQLDAARIRSVLAGLPGLRVQSTTIQTASVTGVIANYATSVGSLLDIDQDIALGSGDPALANSVRALGVISRIEEETSQQRAALGAVLSLKPPTFGPNVLEALVTPQSEMQADIPDFESAATAQQAALYNRTVSGPQVNRADEIEKRAVDLGDSFSNVSGQLANSGVSPQQWFSAVSTKINDMRQVERAISTTEVHRSSQLRRNAILTAYGFAAVVAVVLGLALFLTGLAGRSMEQVLQRVMRSTGAHSRLGSYPEP